MKSEKKNMPKPDSGISVGGKCIGWRGDIEFRGVDIETGEVLFSSTSDDGNNNIAEYLAIIKAMKYCFDNGIKKIIYSNSQTAIRWATTSGSNTSSIVEGRTNRWLQEANLFARHNNMSFDVVFWTVSFWGPNPGNYEGKFIPTKVKKKKKQKK